MFSSKDLFFTPAVSTGYTVSKSLRFRSSASAYLNRTFSSGNRTTWTWSGWVKRGALGVSQWLFDADNGSTDSTEFNFAINSSNALSISGSLTTWRVTTQVFRDPSAWYHIVLAVDTTQAPANNRIRLYVNGSEVTTFSTLNNPTQNLDLAVNQAITHYIGIRTGLTSPLDGYMAEVNFIGGSALDPTSFGEYDTNGIWQPKAYTGSYSGTNSFYLKFTDVGATSGSNAGYGKDFSTNTNYWTTNNFGTTSTAATYDSMLDSPTNATGDIGNYCVLNPLYSGGGYPTLSNANLTATSSTTGVAPVGAYGTIFPSSGKWYCEITPTSGSSAAGAVIGVIKSDLTVSKWYYNGNGNKYTGSVSSMTNDGAYGSTFTDNDVIGVALDLDAGTLTFYKNNSSQGQAYSGLSGEWTFAVADFSTGATTLVANANFGQRPFTYTPPSGYSALNTQNLTTPTITNGAQYMAAVTYSGAGGTQTVSITSSNSGNNPLGTTFQPDLVWIKTRSAVDAHSLQNVITGVQKYLSSDTTGAEATQTNGLTAFNSDGFTLGGGSGWNGSGRTFVSWLWKAGGTGVSNTSGSITSTVSANTSAGFSVVTYTGNGTAGATVGHGLGVAPSMVIVKNRSTSATNWAVYHTGMTSAAYYMYLNSTNAQASSSSIWNSQAPTPSVFYLGDATNTNENTKNLVAYCFAPVAGYSAFGSYTGNGSTDGPFVYTGFRPRYLLIKRTDVANDWVILDSSRNTYNSANSILWADLSDAEASGGSTTTIDFLSNGFKPRGIGGSINTSSGTYIYAAFAENPFKISRAR